MDFFKKNIWHLFYIVVFAGIVLSITMSYTFWQQTFGVQKLKQESIASLYANSTYSILSQYETIFDMLGESLLGDSGYKNIEYTKNRFKQIMQSSPTILGLGVVGQDGNTLVASIDTDVEKLPNILHRKETKDTFLQALGSYRMVLGRTYYHELLGVHVVPLRKAIRDDNAEVLGVVVAAIEAKESFNMGHKNLKTTIYENLIFVREHDSFRQIIFKKITTNDRYDEPVPRELIDSLLERISDKYNLTKDEIKNTQKPFTAVHRKITGEKILLTTSFIDRYQLWVVVESRLEVLMKSFYERLLLVVLSLLLFMVILYILFRQIDRSEGKKKEALRYQAEHDYLTKLNNRHYLSNRFDHKEPLKPFGLMVLNIDDFKNINKNFDHSCGDIALKMFSLRLKEIKKHGDILVRYSGDEFLLVRYDIKKEQMTQLVENVLELLSEPFTIRGLSVVLGISIGAASYPNDGGDFNETKKYADMALQEAKKEKNCYRFFEESIKQKHLRVSMIERELKTALDNDEIYMVYQPQIKSDGTIYGVEALVRWENRLLGFVAPDEFIQIAESTGVMVKLGRYIINRSLKEASEVQKRREAEFRLSINISVKQFKESNFYENLLESIEERGFTKSLLTLEITESLFIENKNEVLSLLGKIRAQGIKISLDDFGTGYSSLSLLRKLPVDELKIDKSFIDDLGHNLDAASIVRLIILISMQLGIGLVAEGVERVEQKDILRGYGCDFYQGYYFSKPLKKDDLLDFLR